MTLNGLGLKEKFINKLKKKKISMTPNEKFSLPMTTNTTIKSTIVIAASTIFFYFLLLYKNNSIDFSYTFSSLNVVFVVVTIDETCRSDEFTCNNGRCIQNRWVCDGELLLSLQSFNVINIFFQLFDMSLMQAMMIAVMEGKEKFCIKGGIFYF